MRAQGVLHALALGVLAVGSAPVPAGLRLWEPALRRLRAAGGARVQVLQRVSPGGAGVADTVRLMITLRPPGWLRLEHADRSFALTLRPDGGEVLDHKLRQLVRLPPAQAARAAGVWSLLLQPDEALVEQRLGPRRSLLLLPEGGGDLPESLWVTVGADSLPTVLEVQGLLGVRLELARWRFVRPPPDSRFRLATPAGYAEVEWP
jgi:hypothetical protein